MANELEPTGGGSAETFVQAMCEECGESSLFPSRILGSVQECPRCGKYMDVMSAEERDAWSNLEDDMDSADQMGEQSSSQ